MSNDNPPPDFPSAFPAPESFELQQPDAPTYSRSGLTSPPAGEDFRTARFYRPSSFPEASIRPDVPEGYVPFGHPPVGAGLRPTRGLGKATSVMFWLVTAMSGLLAFALFARASEWDDFIAGRATLQDLDDADRLVVVSALLQIVLQIASVIVVAMWARRIALNAKARHPWDISPGLAAGGWFIPIGWFWVGFKQLRKSIDAVGPQSKYLSRWQGTFVLAGVLGMILRGFTGEIDVGQTASEIGDTFTREGVVGLITFLVFALAAFFALKAIREIDQTVSAPT